MPIRLGPDRFAANQTPDLGEELGEGEVLFSLLAAAVREMSTAEQMTTVTALQGEGWAVLSEGLRARFDALAEAFLEGDEA